MLVVILKLIIGGFMFLLGLNMCFGKENPFRTKGIGAIVGMLGLLIVLPTLLSFTFYAIATFLCVLVIFGAIKILT